MLATLQVLQDPELRFYPERLGFHLGSSRTALEAYYELNQFDEDGIAERAQKAEIELTTPEAGVLHAARAWLQGATFIHLGNASLLSAYQNKQVTEKLLREWRANGCQVEAQLPGLSVVERSQVWGYRVAKSLCNDSYRWDGWLTKLGAYLSSGADPKFRKALASVSIEEIPSLGFGVATKAETAVRAFDDFLDSQAKDIPGYQKLIPEQLDSSKTLRELAKEDEKVAKELVNFLVSSRAAYDACILKSLQVNTDDYAAKMLQASACMEILDRCTTFEMSTAPN